VELIMAYRGIQLSYETIRRWCETFGASYARMGRVDPQSGLSASSRLSMLSVTVGVDLGDKWSSYCILGLDGEVTSTSC
jgi:transposase-like protein